MRRMHQSRWEMAQDRAFFWAVWCLLIIPALLAEAFVALRDAYRVRNGVE